MEFSSSLKLNEIHKFDGPFNEDPKTIIFSREALISGEGRSENLGKMGNNRDIHSYAKRGVGQFPKRISAPTPWYQNPCDASISYMPGQILGKKKWKSQIFIWPNVFGYGLGIPKMSLKNLHSFWSYWENTWGGGGGKIWLLLVL